jgi:hypothetical protein
MTFLVQDLETIRPIIHRTSGRAWRDYAAG